MGRVGIQDATFRWLRVQRFEAGDVGFTASVEVQLDRRSVVGHEQLSLEPEGIAALAGRVAPVGFAFGQPVPINAHVVADSDGKRIDDVASLRIEVFQVLTQGQEQDFERLVLAMELEVDLTRKPPFIQRLNAPMLLRVSAGGSQVAAKKMPLQRGRGEGLGVGEVTPMGPLRAGKA